MSFRRTALKILVLCAVFLGVQVTPVAAQETVGVRAWQHSDFARVVFDWPAAVEYQAAIEGQVLTIRFARPFTIDLAPIRERLQDYISQSQAGPDGQSLVLQLTRTVTLGDFTNENSVVIDLRPGGEIAEAPTPTPEAPASPAVTQDAPEEAITLGVRVGEHPNYTRIVFDWPVQTSYEFSQDGRAVILDFGRAARVDVAALNESLPAGVRLAASLPGADRTLMTFAVPEAAELRHFPLDSKVVLDVLASSAARTEPAVALDPSQLPAPPAAGPAETPAETAPEVAETLPPEPVVEPEAALPAEEVAETPSEPPSEEPEISEEEAAAALAEQQAQEEDQALADAIDGGAIQFRDGFNPDLALPEAPSAAEEAAAREPVPAPEAEAEEAPPETVAEEAADQPAGPALASFRIPWPQEVGAAVFRRADNIWLVFDSAAEITLTDMRSSSLIDSVDQLPIRNSTVIRARVSDRNINARVKREGFEWVLELVAGPQKPGHQAPISADVNSDIGPHLIFPSDVPGTSLNVPDPEMNDVMRVATFRESGRGIDGLRRYPEFELLPTAQGVAMLPLSDTVLLDRNFDGFQISSPDGLAISAVSPEAPVLSGQTLSARRLFDLAGLMRGGPEDYLEQEKVLIRSLAEVPSEKINEARLAYAGFLMAHDRGPEALGVMRVITRSDEQLMARPENLALKAAASVLAGRTDDALDFLNDPRLDGFAESAIWRGAALALQDRFIEAHKMFGPGDSLLSRYPYPLKGELTLLRIDTALAMRKIKEAQAWIEALEQERAQLTSAQTAALDYFRGLLAIGEGEFELADEIFEESMEFGNRKYAYLSELAMIRFNLNQGTMDDEEALERLERLRYAWRGDHHELTLLRELGELYIAQPDYFEGLGVYRTAVQYFPGDPVAEDLAGEMTQVFQHLFLEGGVDEMSPLRALALYEEFKELTPTGVVGDRVIENIADRLAAIDLLKESAEKLEELLADENRLPPGEERVRLSSKLALVYLMDEEPRKAMDALAKSGGVLEFLEMDPELIVDRDRLRARAHFQLGETDEAIKELAGDVSLEADILRRDIYREVENWQESAKVLQRLAGNPPADPAAPIEDKIGRYVINWAVALHQNADSDGLRDLVDLWGPSMANSDMAGVFDFITQQENAPTGGDVLQTVDQLIGTERFDSFLASYRERLFAPPPPPEVEVSAS